MNEHSLFAELLDITDPEARAAHLDRLSEGQPDLRARLERLFGLHEQAGGFLERSPVPRAEETAYFETAASGSEESPGTKIGPYDLLEVIGEGGMGTVYMAEQTEPMRRRVALKIIKPGMDSQQVVARFESERQALALMDHPNIARVFDGGTTEMGGRPYFVMELVRGLPITDYCDQAKLTVRERLELFTQVCRAVQHAHQKGVIHRDIKPNNVLVTVIDGRPVPKVIDFGIAKATGAALTDRTLFTGFHQLVGTPLYMSPEQAELSGVDVDTRSDVYSLGVLLYQLLTGTTPVAAEALRQAGYDEMRRIIRELEPPTPSRRVSTLGAEMSSKFAVQRQLDARRFDRLMRGELDWVVMRALEKDRGRRYDSAGAFAADVERYLADEPVQAAPPSAGYRLRKFARRNKAGLATAAAVALALVTGTGASVWQGLRADQARRHADERTEAEKSARAEAEANFQIAVDAVDRMLTRVSDEKLYDLPQLETVRRQLLEDALAFHQTFLAARKDDPVRRHATALALLRLGTVSDYLDRFDEARAAIDEGNALLEGLLRADPGNDLYRYNLAFGYNSIGWLKTVSPAEKIEMHTRAADILRPMVDERPADYALRGRHIRGEMASSLRSRAIHLINLGRFDDAERDLTAATALTTGLPGWSENVLAKVYSFRGLLNTRRKRYAEAVEDYRRAIQMHEAWVKENRTGLDRWELSEVWKAYGTCLEAVDRLPEAEDAFRRAVDIVDPLVADFPSTERYRTTANTTRWKWHLLLRRRGDTAEAVRTLDGMHRPLEGDLWLDRAAAYFELDQPQKATQELTSAAAHFRRQAKERGIGNPAPSRLLLKLATVKAIRGRQLLDEKRFDDADPWVREALSIREEFSPDEWPRFNALSMLGWVRFGQKKYAEAERLLLAGHEGLQTREKDLPVTARNRLREAAERVVDLYEATNRRALADEWRAKIPRETLPPPRPVQ